MGALHMVFVMVRRLREILLYADLEFSELMTSVAALMWGLWLLMPWVHLSSPGRPVLAFLTVLAPQNWWAVAAVTIGAAQGVSLARGYPNVRSWATGAAFVMWLFMSLLYLRIDLGNPHAPIYGCLALAAGWAHLRAAVLKVYEPPFEAVRRCSDL